MSDGEAQADPGEVADLSTIVCGVDGSSEGLEAVRQASELVDPGGRIVGVSSWDPGQATHAGIHAGAVAGELREASAVALRDAGEQIAGIEPVLMRGTDAASLLATAAEANADLLSVGFHDTSRAAGYLTGSVATALAHHAPCSVLIARRRPEGGAPPPVVHATDGSAGSLPATRLAARLAARTDAVLLILHVADDGRAGSEILAEEAQVAEEMGVRHEERTETGSPADRICEVAGEVGAGLLIVGSRGLTGLKTLGSVSERVAHEAPCSVLIFRPKTYPAAE